MICFYDIKGESGHERPGRAVHSREIILMEDAQQTGKNLSGKKYKKHNKAFRFRKGIAFRSIFGIVLFLSLFAVIIGFVGYNGFASAILAQYEEGALAGSIDMMEERIQAYIEDITKITAERERISAELSLAARIQEDMLPSDFPAYPERSEFDIHATMMPAKEVGGDFYDFFLIDDDHLCVVMADVSGKGIPAALFMMVSMILNQ